MKDIAELLKAIAALLWPLVALFALSIFKPQIRDILQRIKRGKVLGQEIELNESLTRLDATATAVESEVASLPPAQTQLSISHESQEADTIGHVLSLSAQSPKASLLVLASEMERELRQLLASMGLLGGTRYMPFQQAIEILNQRGGLPRHVTSSVKLFRDVRNRLVHGIEANPNDILRAIDSGVTILRSLQAIPHETNIVYHSGVPVFHDAKGEKPIDGVQGVILQTESPGGASKMLRIYPTTRTHFQKGEKVAWEWSNERVFGEAWYRDPDTNEIKYAWTSSMEFIGRHLEDV